MLRQSLTSRVIHHPVFFCKPVGAVWYGMAAMMNSGRFSFHGLTDMAGFVQCVHLFVTCCEHEGY